MRRTPGHLLRRALPLLFAAGVLVPVAAAQGAETLTGTLDPAAPNALGWYTGPVTVNWTSSDPLTYPSFSQPVTADGIYNPLTGTSCNPLDLNVPQTDCISGTVSFKLDQTPPTVSITRPVGTYDMGPGGVIGLQNEPITAIYNCDDTLSGVAPGKGPGTACAGPVPSGQPLLPPAVLGGTDDTFSVTATNGAGLTNTVTSTYHVRPAPPALILPSADETTNDRTPDFQWNASVNSSVDHYTLFVNNAAVASVPAAACAGGVCSVTSPELAVKTPLVWFVRAFGVDGPQKDSTSRTLTVDPSVPGPPTLTGGPVGTTTDATPTFSWDGAGPQFKWQINGPGDAVVRGPVTTGSVQATVSPALSDGAYQFQVRQAGANGVFGSAAVVSFTVDTSSPPTTVLTAGTVVVAQPPPAPSTPPVITKKKSTKKGSKAVLTPKTLNATLLTPKAGARIRDLTPTLRWKKRPKGAQIFNLQIFQGTHKVLSRFPTGLSYTVPAGVLKPGKQYIWRVWPYFGIARGYPKNPLGLTYLDVANVTGKTKVAVRASVKG